MHPGQQVAVQHMSLGCAVEFDVRTVVSAALATDLRASVVERARNPEGGTHAARACRRQREQSSLAFARLNSVPVLNNTMTVIDVERFSVARTIHYFASRIDTAYTV